MKFIYSIFGVQHVKVVSLLHTGINNTSTHNPVVLISDSIGLCVLQQKRISAAGFFMHLQQVNN